MRTYDDVRRIAGQHLGEFGRAERVDDIDNAGCAGKIACPVVFRQLVYQTVQRLHMLGGKQVALIDCGLDQVADIGVNIERMHFRAFARQHIPNGFGGSMVPIARRDG